MDFKARLWLSKLRKKLKISAAQSAKLRQIFPVGPLQRKQVRFALPTLRLPSNAISRFIDLRTMAQEHGRRSCSTRAPGATTLLLAPNIGSLGLVRRLINIR
jgi:hypothetical protein